MNERDLEGFPELVGIFLLQVVLGLGDAAIQIPELQSQKSALVLLDQIAPSKNFET